MTGNVVLCLAHVRSRYGGRDVLHDVSLTIRSGEAHCLLGENGAGKTTLIRSILGRMRLESGHVAVSGGIGFVPQEVALFPRLTVRENLTTFARLAGLRGDLATRVAETAAATGLCARLDEVLDTLSGGWRRRVDIAAATLHRPALLLLDEPSAGVDVAAREALHEMIGGLVREEMAVLMTTHDMAEAEAVCTHIAILSGGRMVEAGPLEGTLRNRFADQLCLTLSPRPRYDARSLASLGFETSCGAPTALVADDDAALARVAQIRAAGIALDGFGVERPGLARLYRSALEVAA